MRVLILLVVIVGLAASIGSPEERPSAKVVATWDGDPVYQVLPVGAIPAIDKPEYVTGEEAETQMKASEPVIGVVLGGEARAYSLWHLDAHEIVNDAIAGTAIAATW